MKCAHPRAPSPAPRSHTEEEERTEGVLNPTRRATCRARFLDRSSAAPSPRCLLTIILRSLGALNSGRVSLFPRDEGLLSPDFGSESNSQHFSNTQLREELTAKGAPRSNVRTPPRGGGRYSSHSGKHTGDISPRCSPGGRGGVSEEILRPRSSDLSSRLLCGAGVAVVVGDGLPGATRPGWAGARTQPPFTRAPSPAPITRSSGSPVLSKRTGQGPSVFGRRGQPGV